MLRQARLRLNPTSLGPHGDYHVGHQTWANKLTQADEGVGPSLLFSMRMAGLPSTPPPPPPRAVLSPWMWICPENPLASGLDWACLCQILQA